MNGKIKVGIIGVGSIAQRHHIPALKERPDVEIVAICDSEKEIVDRVARDFSIKREFTDYNDLLSIEEIDAVHICTPNFLHKDPTVKALDAGKHVLVEKPIAHTAADGAEMVEAARRSGKQLMVGYCWRWHPGARIIKRFIEAGDMGEIYYARVHALRKRGIPEHGVFTQKDKQGGGPLIDIGCHLLDLTLWLMGSPVPISASGQCYTKFGNRPGIGNWDHSKYTVEDFATGLIRFKNGATLNIETSFAANIDSDSLNTTLLGTEGGCELDPLKIFRQKDQTIEDLTPTDVPLVNWRRAEIFEFIDAIRDGSPVPIPGDQVLTVSKIIDAIYESANEGREVTIG